jgi:hypothetical protein
MYLPYAGKSPLHCRIATTRRLRYSYRRGLTGWPYGRFERAGESLDPIVYPVVP